MIRDNGIPVLCSIFVYVPYTSDSVYVLLARMEPISAGNNCGVVLFPSRPVSGNFYLTPVFFVISTCPAPR